MFRPRVPALRVRTGEPTPHPAALKGNALAADCQPGNRKSQKNMVACHLPAAKTPLLCGCGIRSCFLWAVSSFCGYGVGTAVH